jgi:hypothetical protein
MVGIEHNLCLGCGEIEPSGIIALISHHCPINTVYYYRNARFSMEMFEDLVSKKDRLQPFKDLLDYPHFKAIEVTEATTELDKKIYSILREMEIKQMKRMREYIKLEEKFYITHSLN